MTIDKSPKIFKRVDAAIAKGEGTRAFGQNLYLRVGANGSASWLFRYRFNGAENAIHLGLGSATGEGKAKVSKDAARRAANKLLVMIAEGEDPRAERRRTKGGVTFADRQALLLDHISKDWRRDIDGRRDWEQSLKLHAASLLPMPVAKITTQDVLAVLGPKWGTETMVRVQQRIEKVLDAAVADGLAKTNVARWKGHLSNLLGKKPAKAKRGEQNFAALPYDQVPAVLAKLATQKGMGATALRFTILTAARTEEVLGAKKSEIDREARTWSRPAERMKNGKPHTVTLSNEAMEIVNAVWERPGEFLFATDGERLGETALSDKFCKPAKKGGLGYAGKATVHGFRSSFSTWAQEKTSIKDEVVERCLAHEINVDRTGSGNRANYARGEMLEMRFAAMQSWANWCMGKSTLVTLQLVA